MGKLFEVEGECMPIFKTYITETLQREVEVEAADENEAVEKTEELYKDSEVILDYSDLTNTEFSNCKYSEKEVQIMNQISNFCEKECGECQCCPEDTCVLFRIEKIIEDGFYGKI